MGARSSKTKPNAREDGSPGRRGASQTFIVTVDTQDEVEDEVQSAVSRADTGGVVSDASKVSKVQEILEGRVELRRQQQLEHLPHTSGVSTPSSLELQFSSSEESEESDTGASGKKRKGFRKKKKQPKKKETAAGTPSSLKLKLGEIKPSKKTIPPLAHPATKTEHFEQIKDAYSMMEYTTDDAPYTPKPAVDKELRAQEQQIAPQQLSPGKLKQQLSPRSSPSKFFSGAYDNWKRSMQSSNRSGRSVIMETRDSSRRSPPKSASNSSFSQKSVSSQNGDRKGKKWETKQSDIESDAELEEFECESTRWQAPNASVHNQSIELKFAEGRGASATAPMQQRRPVSERRNLRIDDMDESIMDDILAEVIE